MSETAASPYSTGGGGVRLEHQYAATLLAAVLAGDPIAELGDSVKPVAVRLQVSELSPVDDIMVEGNARDGSTRRVFIGVRRNPSLTTSDSSSVPLVRAYLEVVVRDWAEVQSGRTRLALAVAVSSAAVNQLERLATIAQTSSSAAAFFETVQRAGTTNAADRSRLTHLQSLVTEAIRERPDLSIAGSEELTWRWLSSLFVRKLRLEGIDTSDRTAAVALLRHVVQGETLPLADSIFSALVELSGVWASTGARIDEALMRKTLSSFPIQRSSAFASAWTMFDSLARRLRDGIRPDLTGGGVQLEIDRPAARADLQRAMAQAGETSSSLIVTGEPDVGKSALTLRAGEALVTAGASVLWLSLRDLPKSVLELESFLGSPLTDVLASAEVRPTRLMVVDGSEYALEGWRDVLNELATTALRSGIGFVAVTRADGLAQVRESLLAAGRSAGADSVAESVVTGLAQVERDELIASFPSLAGLSGDTRSSWLVGRPGLVDLLLRAGTIAGEQTLLSEADVFVTVWNKLVRRSEVHVDGTSPEDRERALLSLARRALSGTTAEAPPAGALSSLKSDGLLRVPASAALSFGDDFATDLIRDFALCRLFLESGWQPLIDAGAPRWTIRAVRLACQARLVAGDLASSWRELDLTFRALSADEGVRWSELPVEALLTVGRAQDAIEAVWDQLLSDEHAGLTTLLRLALQRNVDSTIGDPFVLAPLVAVTFVARRESSRGIGQAVPRSSGPSVRKIVLAWLRGLLRANQETDPLRCAVRDRILDSAPDPSDTFAVEAIAMLGPDLDGKAEAWLRGIAIDDPYHLSPAVHSIGSIVSIADFKPGLLIDLAEAFYIEKPTSTDDDDWSSASPYDEGIRDLDWGGFGDHAAAWSRGPFWRLLVTSPIDSLAMINRILDHAANYRIATSHALQRRRGEQEPAQADPLTVYIPGIGERSYVGDDHAWSWYRGSSAGPYTCMSALLAVERFADHLVDDLQIPMSTVVGILIRDAHNVAMLGLVVGLLIRHPHQIGELLDPFLREPRVWSLEFMRATIEGTFHAQGPDLEATFGRDRRSFTLRDAAAEITWRAISDRDVARIAELGKIADELIANWQQDADAADADGIVVVQGWASSLRVENYKASPDSDGSGTIVQIEPPEEITRALAAGLVELNAERNVMRLAITYSQETTFQVATLLADIRAARSLPIPIDRGSTMDTGDAIAAVAAAAIRSHHSGAAAIDDDDLEWAAQTLIAAALSPRTDFMSFDGSMFSMGADRSAARALPLLSLPRFDQIPIDRSKLAESLLASATSLFDEVRVLFTANSSEVWAEPCGDADSANIGCVRHTSLWAAFESAIAKCRLGPWDRASQRRQPSLLSTPYVQTLPSVPVEDLIVNRLVPPISSAVSARTTPCLTAHVATLISVLLEAHRIAADKHFEKGYSGYSSAGRELVSRALLELALGGDEELLELHLRTFANNANALQALLSDFSLIFTYDIGFRPKLSAFWPRLLDIVLTAVDQGATLGSNRNWSDYAIAALLPVPRIRPSDPNIEGTLALARSGWITPGELAPEIDRWLKLAKHEPKAAEAIVQFAVGSSIDWQIAQALEWVERIVAEQYGPFVGHSSALTSWLAQLRNSGRLDTDGARRWRRLVDGLAASGDGRGAELQRLSE